MSGKIKAQRPSSSVNAKGLAGALLKWFAANARDLPWRRTSDPYAIWVSEIMLQQTRVSAVIPYWERWLRELPTLTALADASSETIHRLWAGLGYYSRVRNLKKAARVIVENHSGQFPKNLDDLLALPGIGRYTAGAIASIAFGKPAPILDGNVIRVLTRLHGIGDDPRAKTTNARLWALADELVHATTNCSHLNQSLMELGALVCTPRTPRCEDCPLRADCVAHQQGTTAELPNLRPRPASIQRRVLAFVIQRGEKFLVRQRPATGVNAHLWEFPNLETSPGLLDVPALAAREKIPLRALTPLCVVNHSITRNRIRLEVWRGEWNGKKTAAGQWKTHAQLSTLAFPGAHRKILKAAGLSGSS